MPLYEYKCSKCASVFEILQKVDAAGLEKCLKCGAPVHKIISSSALQFKGSGWYVTDYAQKDKKKPKSKEPKKITDAPVKKEAKKTSPAAPTE